MVNLYILVNPETHSVCYSLTHSCNDFWVVREKMTDMRRLLMRWRIWDMIWYPWYQEPGDDQVLCEVSLSQARISAAKNSCRLSIAIVTIYCRYFYSLQIDKWLQIATKYTHSHLHHWKRFKIFKTWIIWPIVCRAWNVYFGTF